MQNNFQVVENIDVDEVEDIADAPGFDGDRCESCKWGFKHNIMISWYITRKTPRKSIACYFNIYVRFLLPFSFSHLTN